MHLIYTKSDETYKELNEIWVYELNAIIINIIAMNYYTIFINMTAIAINNKILMSDDQKTEVS